MQTSTHSDNSNSNSNSNSKSNDYGIPEPILQEVDNRTGIAHFQFDKMAPGRKFCDIVVLKASFALNAQGLDRTALPANLCYADLHHDEQDPLGSSLRECGDLIVAKPGADLYLTGHAHTDKARAQFIAQVKLVQPDGTTLLNHRCQALGPRYWYSLLPGIWRMSESTPTQRVPLRYELCWGGRDINPDTPADDWHSHLANPSGSGYSFKHLRLSQTSPGIQWEPARFAPGLHREELVGFGPVARFWASRAQYAGTYGKEWQAKLDEALKRKDHLKGPVVMDYAPDFDWRFFQAAHPAMQSPQPLHGDETLELYNLHPDTSSLQARLPAIAIVATFEYLTANDASQASRQATRQSITCRVALDTIHIDTDSRVAHLVWRLSLPQSLGVQSVQLQRMLLDSAARRIPLYNNVAQIKAGSKTP
jgi:hypothetical protein